MNALAFPDLAAFAVRLLATGGVVLGITLAVGRLGATAGGMLAGLPIVVGPGLVFLALEEDPAFLARTATFALLSLCATQSFMLAYLAAARRLRPALSISLAFFAWAAAAMLLSRIEIGAVAALAMFAGATLVGRVAGKRLLIPGSQIRSRDSLLALLLRASLAGMLVGGITATTSRLGPQLSGLLMAYPVGMTVIAVSIHMRYGATTVMKTLYATALGTTSLATFCFLVAITAPAFGSGVALALGFGGCILLTTSLLATQR